MFIQLPNKFVIDPESIVAMLPNTEESSDDEDYGNIYLLGGHIFLVTKKEYDTILAHISQ